MTNIEYTEAVARGEYPEDRRVPIDHAFQDERGAIDNLLLNGCTSVAAIYSKRGSVRANHWHKTDDHYTYVVKGTMFYFERPVGERGEGLRIAVGPGEMFYTRPGVEHAMLFASDSVILTFAKKKRDHESHEADVVRVEYITPEIAEMYVPHAKVEASDR
jgi:quercetin dioxygenase-like cupin family protein